MKKTLVFMSAVFALTVVSCKSTGANAATSVEKTGDMSKNLNGEWVLNSITTPATADKELSELYSGKQPGLTFDVKEKRVHGNDGCNNLTGGFDLLEGNGIKIGDKLGSTMMFCQGVADAEFKAALNTVTNYKVAEKELIFYAGDVVVMTFKKK